MIFLSAYSHFHLYLLIRVPIMCLFSVFLPCINLSMPVIVSKFHILFSIIISVHFLFPYSSIRFILIYILVLDPLTPTFHHSIPFHSPAFPIFVSLIDTRSVIFPLLLFTSIFCLCLSTHLIILLIFVISLTFVLNISHTHILQFILYLPSQSISPPCS